MTAVSVVVPAYNRAETLPRAIDSVLAQTVDEFELVVVDDGSTDDTHRVVGGYDDDRIVSVRLPTNRGANAARNAGIDRAKGEFVSFLDSDDELAPTHLERATSALRDAPPACVGVYTAFRRFHDGRFVDVSRARDEVTYDDVVAANVIGSFSCTTFRRNALVDVGGLDESLESAQDYDLYLRLLADGHVIGIDELLTNVYKRGDSIGFQLGKKLAGNRAIREKHGDALDDRRLATQYFAEGIRFGRAGQLPAATARFGRAMDARFEPLYLYFYLSSILGERAFELSYALSTRLRAYYRAAAHEAARRRD